MSDTTAIEHSPAQRAFLAAAATIQDDYIAALDRAARARRIFHNADSGSLERDHAEQELHRAVAELRMFRGEIDDQVAA